MVFQHGVSRRQFLVAGAVLAAAGTLSAGTVAAAAPADQFDQLRRAWSDILTGASAVNPADPDFAAAITRLDAAASAAIARYDNSAAPRSVYTDLPFSRPENSTATYNRILTTAIAWATPGSRFHQVTSVADRLVAGLKVIGTKYYTAGQPEVGNWWEWEIGSPQALVNACAVLGNQIPPADLATYLAAVAHFDPDPGHNTTGANRTDKCQITILRGILAKDAALITVGRDTLSGTFPYVTTSDGFYRDGGFVFHNDLPYAGHYGFVLLDDLSQLNRLLTGSNFPITDPNFAIILNAIDHSYAPFMRDGLVMDVVRGRAISRQFETDHDAGHIITEAVLGLAPFGSADQQRRWKSLAKAWITDETFAPILASALPARVALVKQVLDDPSVVPAPPTAAHLQFPSIERAVHTRAAWTWTVGLAGRAIARYEAINGENKRGWHIADGATYLYNDDNGHYTDAYWPTVDSQRLAGTTVDSLPLANGAGAGSRPPTTFAGGVVSGSYGAIGLDLVPIGSPMRARKSWFCLDDMVVALGAGITGGSGHPIETVVENRNLGASGGNVLIVDGQQQPTTLGWNGQFSAANWAHLDGVGGYVFPGGADLKALRQARTGAWVDIDDGASTSGTATPFTRRYVTVWFDHGTAPKDVGYAYLLLPGATAQATAAAAHAEPVAILANSSAQQAIRVPALGLTAAVCFVAGSVGGTGIDTITVSAPCAVLTRTVNGATTLTVADPTLTLSSVTVTVGHRTPVTIDLAKGVPGASHEVTLPS
ncbi:MAG TPA: polysaccharide lyase 8 family protein [Pseudonocardiaceae bacterium]|nr:polysaccharide lyase 8 family protein [Pseudonocardiaceae bacterium]